MITSPKPFSYGELLLRINANREKNQENLTERAQSKAPIMSLGIIWRTRHGTALARCASKYLAVFILLATTVSSRAR